LPHVHRARFCPDAGLLFVVPALPADLNPHDAASIQVGLPGGKGRGGRWADFSRHRGLWESPRCGMARGAGPVAAGRGARVAMAASRVAASAGRGRRKV